MEPLRARNVDVLIPNKVELLPALYCFFESGDFLTRIREINQKVDINTSTIGDIPFDSNYWKTVAENIYPNGLPEPYSNDPTQWIFHGHPCRSIIWDKELKWTTHGPLRTDETVLQVAVVRLLGFQWPSETDDRIVLCKEAKVAMEETGKLGKYIDEDGIVCIPPVRGELGADDRLENLLAAAYGNQWTPNTLSELLTSVGHEGKTLESWLRDKFYSQHFKLFNNRPFIWHIWDGLRDAFSALINYHKLDQKLLETLIYTYLGDWIRVQRQEVAGGVDGSEERLYAAEALKHRLEQILVGEAPYDIFVRWKPLEEQSNGWTPDLNDGIRLNIRPFMMIPDVKRKGSGVLREKAYIHWKKDRGKDVKSAPWYSLGVEYGGKEGDRINDHHLTLNQKQTMKR